MNKYKTFIIGCLAGSLMVGAASYASDTLSIDVKIPDLHLSLDGHPISLGGDGSSEAPPAALEYKATTYVPLRQIAEALDKEIDWNEETGQVSMTTIEHVPFRSVDPAKAGPEIKTWVEDSKKIEMAQMRTFKDGTYILITRGEKMTGGYDAQVQDVRKLKSGYEVVVNLVSPPKGNLIIQPIEYPLTLVRLDRPIADDVRFVDEDGQEIPKIHLNDPSGFIPPIAKSNDNMAVFDPVRTDGGILLKGVTRDFEGIVYYELTDPRGKVLNKGSIQAENADPDWGYFQKEWSIAELTGVQSIDLYTIHAKEGPASKTIQVPIAGLLRTPVSP